MKLCHLLSIWLFLIALIVPSTQAAEPNASLANSESERGKELLQKAEVEIFQWKSSSNDKSRAEHQRRARRFLEQAREAIEPAFDEHVAAFRKFPAFVDEQKQPKLWAQRNKVETSMILESLDLAKCTYLEVQTHDPASPERQQLLKQAAEEYETIYFRYRTQMGGLYAHLWQGKCCQEFGDTAKALEIYSELLDLPEGRQGLQNLKSQTLQFKLICLNSTDEWQSVVDLANEWLEQSGADSKTSVGLGIQWEQARALEALGDDAHLPKADQDRFWRKARTVAQQINRLPGEYKDVSLTMMQRLQEKLDDRRLVANDFSTAYVLGRQAFNHALELKTAFDAGIRSRSPSEEVEGLRRDFLDELNVAASKFELAATLVNMDDESRDVAMSRLLQAYSYFYLRRNYEAAILAQFLARTTKESEGSFAVDAAYMSMAALVQAYYDNSLDVDQKLDDLQLVIKAAVFITNRWPDSDKANEASMVLGGMSTNARKPIDAVEWYLKIPETDAKFPEAQLAAGTAYWIAYRAAGSLPLNARPTDEKRAEWLNAAKRHLRIGIGMWSARQRNRREAPPELINAKIYLAEILLTQGHPADSVKILVTNPGSVVDAVAVVDEAQRPAAGVQSRAVAKSAYILLVRALIGTGPENLDEARKALKTLESITLGDPNSDRTDVDNLRVELDRLEQQ